ncbi:MAG: glycosyltransferase family 4 protein [Nitrospirae bacterium]|nr:glycosyltransferase family 4 protein [Nitrospirota bacterium]
MKIFYLSQVNLNKHYSGSVHVKETVRELAAAGNSVLLFAQLDDNLIGTVPGVRVQAIGLIRGGIISYLWYQFKLLLTVLYQGIKEKPDILYVRSESAMFAHILVSKLLKVPCFLELNSWPFRDFENVRDVSPVMRAFIAKIIIWSITASKGIICVTGEIAARLREKYHRNHGIVVAENGVNIELFRPLSVEKTREELGLEKKDFIVGFVAYFQYYNDAELAIKAIKALREKNPNIKLLLVGGWAQQERMEKVQTEAMRFNGNAVLITDEVPYSDVPKYIACFDLALALFNKDVGDGSVMKAYEYLACSKAVVGSEMSSLRFLEEREMGITVPIGNLDALINSISILASDRDRAEKMGARGFDYITKYKSWGMVTDKILCFIANELKGKQLEVRHE